MTLTNIKKIIDTFPKENGKPDKRYLYGLKLNDGRDIIFTTALSLDGKPPKPQEGVEIPEPWTIDEDTNTLKYSQNIQTQQGPQMPMMHFLDLDKVVQVLVFKQ